MMKEEMRRTNGELEEENARLKARVETLEGPRDEQGKRDIGGCLAVLLEMLEDSKSGRVNLKTLAVIASIMATANGLHEPEIHAPGVAGIPHMVGLHSTELAELIENVRKDPFRPDDHCPEFTNSEIEIADSFIRMLDLIGHVSRNLLEVGASTPINPDRIAHALVSKMIFNASRPFRHGKNC